MARTLGLKGLDVSKYQTSLPSLAGQSFIILRASISVTKDSLYDQHYANARKAGLVVMAYHYGYPASVDSPIQKQVNTFLAIAKDADFLWIDQEEAGFTDEQTQQFIDLVHDAGRPIGLYHSACGFAGVNADAQWIADYRSASVTAGYPMTCDASAEYGGWDLWQWTSKGTLSGYTGSLDLDWLNPTSRLASLLRLGYMDEDLASKAIDDAVAAAIVPYEAQVEQQATQISGLQAELASATLKATTAERERIAKAEADRIKAI